MAGTFLINQLMIKSKSMMKLERLQQDLEMVTQFGDGCLLDYQYFLNHYQLIAVDLSKQKELDADPRAIQQIDFYGMLRINLQECAVFQNSKETVLEFYKGTAKVL